MNILLEGAMSPVFYMVPHDDCIFNPCMFALETPKHQKEEKEEKKENRVVISYPK
jgi:hypothetical protein